jgi:hypothetical protein
VTVLDPAELVDKDNKVHRSDKVKELNLLISGDLVQDFHEIAILFKDKLQKVPVVNDV